MEGRGPGFKWQLLKESGFLILRETEKGSLMRASEVWNHILKMPLAENIGSLKKGKRIRILVGHIPLLVGHIPRKNAPNKWHELDDPLVGWDFIISVEKGYNLQRLISLK
jgi:hypothetical protein